MGRICCDPVIFNCEDVRDCRNPIAGKCPGHTMRIDYSSTSGTGSFYLDDEKFLCVGDEFIEALTKLLNNFDDVLHNRIRKA